MFACEEVCISFDFLGRSIFCFLACDHNLSFHLLTLLRPKLLQSRQLQETIMNCEQILQNIKTNKPILQSTLRQLGDKLIQILAEESNLLELQSPINVIGDIHGQYYDLLKLLDIGGELPQRQYLFLGDYVDRGYHSIETFLLLAVHKIMYPNRIYLLRGNHQSRQISSMYGFYEESQKKYGTVAVWKLFNDIFDYLPLAALINSDIFCLHGGLSPDIHTVEQINDIDRICEIPTSGGFGDLVWSDPDEIQGWMLGSRGVGWLFGNRVVNEFNYHNWLKLIVRSHQLVQQGYQYWFKGQLVTVWSAPNYCYRCGNQASVMRVSEQGQSSFQTFTADPRSIQSVHYKELIPYFL